MAARVIQDVFRRVATDRSRIAERDVELHPVPSEERADRVARASVVHIAFCFGVRVAGTDVHHGALLVQLQEAISVAWDLKSASEEGIAAMRATGVVDTATKRVMPELGSFVATAVDAALRAAGVARDGAGFEGCQEVRADVPPRLNDEEGAPLSTARATSSTATRPAVEIVFMMPREESLLAAVRSRVRARSRVRPPDGRGITSCRGPS